MPSPLGRVVLRSKTGRGKKTSSVKNQRFLPPSPKGKALFVIARAERPVAISWGNVTAGDRHVGAAPRMAMTNYAFPSAGIRFERANAAYSFCCVGLAFWKKLCYYLFDIEKSDDRAVWIQVSTASANAGWWEPRGCSIGLSPGSCCLKNAVGTAV